MANVAFVTVSTFSILRLVSSRFSERNSRWLEKEGLRKEAKQNKRWQIDMATVQRGIKIWSPNLP